MSIDSISISDIMSKDVKVEVQNQNIFAVAKIMSDNNVGSVIIIDNHENKSPVGIVTERDILRILGSLKPDLLQTPVKELMSHPIIPLSIQATISDALTLMQEKKIRRIPIVDKNNNLVGIVTENDIFKVLMKNKDLLSVVSNGKANIAQKPIYNDFIRFWFDETA
ncbi:MAG TPA: CBS domain-containing protein [Verrucomicrobiae bacterium]|nr:CBS domain-containing protein [Candidatus Sulfopaludibacter sp.]HXT83255.1 CBS domain-containing protein [Verrucomicrobiae bacterium]